jgi:hypothetical protein
MSENSVPESENASAPVLGLADLKNVLIVIDLASSRGAFKPAEFAAVGSVYSKIASFLEVAAPAGDAASETSAE